ncbi:hypothetical protein ASE06_07235 [Sphingopyxis sp. Root214]|uniref:SRPBCC family protein n=1 Tax=unclassified Sphingopyxis TaxID=2614943 RepID=UPI0007005B63|nr:MULTISPECIES: SRPBCC domain-containing protein [unclassified Sphingopyxis]KQZ76490.1 hypothetical protein ASD73_00760 [Sphingopyxis sp. Root154]KRC09623.1 hypothetical protein ASE06_07235 [Sphingopyxis sp. Root214]
MHYPRHDIRIVAESPAVEPILHIRRSFDAPPALLWRAWSQPDSLVAWMGSAVWPAFSVSSDFRVGGAWRTGLKSPETGEELWQGGRYVEIVEPERLAFTFKWEGCDEDGPAAETLVTIEFSETDAGRTTMDFTHAGLKPDNNPDGHRHGWTSAVDRLAAWLVDNPD